MRSPSHTHVRTHANWPRINGRRSPRTINVHARVGGPRLPAATSRTTASTREDDARVLARLVRLTSILPWRFLLGGRRRSSALAFSARRGLVACRGPVGCCGSALLLLSLFLSYNHCLLRRGLVLQRVDCKRTVSHFSLWHTLRDTARTALSLSLSPSLTLSFSCVRSGKTLGAGRCVLEP